MNQMKEPIQNNDSFANRTTLVSVAPPTGSNRDQTVRVQIVDTYVRCVLNASHSSSQYELESVISVGFSFIMKLLIWLWNTVNYLWSID